MSFTSYCYSARSHLLVKIIAMVVASAVVPWAAAADLDTFIPEPQAMPVERVFDGRIEAVKQATVSAETRGRVEEIRVDIGDFVSMGTVVLTMTRTEQRAGLNQAEANLAEAEANLAAENSEFARIADLFEKKFVSKADYDRATARLDTAKARVASAEAALKTARQQLSYTEIKAPYSGVLSARHVEPGEAVQPGTPLMSGYDPRVLRVEVDVPQQVADQIRKMPLARIVTANAHELPELEFIVPEKIILYPVADPVTSTVRVRLELPALESGLRPGEFVKVTFTVAETQRLLVPVSSVVYRSEVTAVYVVKNGIPTLRQVRPGAMFVIDGNQQLEVLAGLLPGDAVAVDPIAAATALATSSQRDAAID